MLVDRIVWVREVRDGLSHLYLKGLLEIAIIKNKLKIIFSRNLFIHNRLQRFKIKDIKYVVFLLYFSLF